MGRKKEVLKYAPDVDSALHIIERLGTISGHELSYRRERLLLEQIGQVLEILDNSHDEEDTRINLWFTAERGAITDWRTYDEAVEYEEINSREEYEQFWLDYYPDEIKFYECYFIRHGKLMAISLGERGLIESPEEIIQDKPGVWADTTPLLKWALEQCRKAVQQIIAGDYDGFIKNKLPYYYRTGTIPRQEYWKIIPEGRKYDLAGRDDIILSEEEIKIFQKLVAEQKAFSDDDFIIEDMTAAKYFAYCRLGYEANNFPHCKKIEDDVELYKRIADGRDNGLTEIALDSPEAFNSWKNGKLQVFNGNHPWEVIRGGSSTHVTFSVSNRLAENKEGRYYLYLAGLHRPGEVIRFFIALRQHGIMVKLGDMDALLARCLGTDKMGIVPNGVLPRYCEKFFPEEKVVDFINIHYWDDEYPDFVEKTTWQEVKTPQLVRDWMTVKELLQYVDMEQLVDKEYEANENKPADRADVYKLWQTFLRKMSEYPCQKSEDMLVFMRTWDGLGDEVEEFVDVSLYRRSDLDESHDKVPHVALLSEERLQQMSEEELIEYHKGVYAEVPEGYAFDFTPWEEMLGFKVNIGNLRRVGLQECIHSVLTEMTFHGMMEDDQSERRQELDEAIEEIEEIRTLPQEEQEQHFKSYEDVCEEMGWKDERSPEVQAAGRKRFWYYNAVTANSVVSELKEIVKQ
ncbi:DUF6557 family protein [Selenomonas sp. KH1T6]|uniref:DUF6557 family protein n=1 Tax=Selenomonas sp. KH1T6 TaxID=3158784 RepID=UPI0008A75769|nr:hypothetical protein SAMN05216583_1385 [Selenomonas ruminantium]